MECAGRWTAASAGIPFVLTCSARGIDAHSAGSSPTARVSVLIVSVTETESHGATTPEGGAPAAAVDGVSGCPSRRWSTWWIVMWTTGREAPCTVECAALGVVRGQDPDM